MTLYLVSSYLAFYGLIRKLPQKYLCQKSVPLSFQTQLQNFNH